MWHGRSKGFKEPYYVPFKFCLKRSMFLPANFDSVSLDGVLEDWLCALREFSVEALMVLGPDPFGGQEDRLVLAIHPPRLLDAAEALAESRDFGAPWRGSDAPLVAWQDISKTAFENLGRWRRLWLAHGYQSVVRIAFPLTVGRAFECYLFSPRQWHDRSEAALLAVEGHKWPGNIRELENCIKRAVIMADGNQITQDDIGLKGAAPEAADNSLDLRVIRDKAERGAVIAALGRVNGNMVKAAELLGVSRPTLYDLMHRLGLK